MSWYWVNFAKDGNPNGKGLPIWPAFDPDKQQVMELGDHFGPVPIASSHARFEFWRHFFATQTAW
jgi:para-nitrobenzyl esterase